MPTRSQWCLLVVLLLVPMVTPSRRMPYNTLFGNDGSREHVGRADAGAGPGAGSPSQWDPLWNFLLNLATYGTLLVPAYFLIRCLQKSPHLTHGPFLYSKLLRSCALGLDTNGSGGVSLVEEGAGDAGVVSPLSTRKARFLQLQQLEQSVSPSTRLTICVLGLQVSYVTWGVLQERIMTRQYGGEDSPDGSAHAERFTNSQFLVLVNRVLAFLVASVAVATIPHPAHATPLYKYSFCSISNILSSWCQYEALKYVTFPTQVLFKSCKVIPVMLMGKCVNGKSYAWFEYGLAVLISVGVSVFLLANAGEHRKAGAVTTVAGVIILCGYLTFDSFTSNWQKNLFDQYKISPLQMMMGVNMFSCLFTLASLLQRGQLLPSLAFLQRHPTALYNITLLSLFSAVGQLFIFYTVRAFGPLTLAIIMTTRQLISIILSCLLYGHVISPLSVVGAAIAFTAVFSQAYLKSRGWGAAGGKGKKARDAGPPPRTGQVVSPATSSTSLSGSGSP